MAIYDNNGTTDCEIGKIYDNNGTTDYQIGKVYDNNGTVDSLVYTSSSVIVPNPTEYPASAYVTNQSNKSSVRDFTVDGTKAYMSLYYSDNCWADWKLEFETKGHKYLNITYSATA
ncbi:MAG: hypothetical protein IKT63_03670, partial [Oscillospiraceae bacterium]|nr:hypothetical protein [Oscillospiraceae bacterium]